ncbi:MAG: hypothetical protein ACI8YQ_001949 [Polaribacter sp.]
MKTNTSTIGIFLSILFLFCSNIVFSQIVNIEKKRTSKQDSVYWTGDINLGAALIQNSKQIVSINTAMRIDYTRYRHVFMSISDYRLGRVDNNDFINTGFQHFRYNYKINKRWSLEAFTQAQYNEQIQLQLRWLLGVGPRIGLLLDEKKQLYLGTLYMYEYAEEKAEGEEVLFFREHRLSTYLNVHLQPLDYLKISSTTYFQPVITSPDDFRLSTETAVEMKITERLTFTTIFSLLYDSTSPSGIRKTIYSLKNGLRLKF